MGLAVRVFLVEDDGYLRRLPLARYERLLRGEAEGFFPQYAGKRVRYAFVVVDLVDCSVLPPSSSIRWACSRISPGPPGALAPGA